MKTGRPLHNKTTLIIQNSVQAFYTFNVKAVNSDDVWSKPSIYSFEIKPVFWQTWWFRVIIAILAIGAIYAFLKNRERRLNKKNQYELQMTELKLKALQSQMNPHFLFNSLNSVQNYILTNRGIEGAKFLSKFSKLVRQIMENSNHQYLRFEQIIETLKMYVEIESFRFNHEFYAEFNIEENEILLDSLLPPMLLQPYVENAIWHGLILKEGDKTLLITAYISNNHIFCKIEDNGIGRSNIKIKEGHISRGQEMTKGIFDSLRNRNSQAKLEIIDLFDDENKPRGTRVEMVVPIEPN
jgi:LytS/YehU family sensor histidine kinase